ncbi:hypothetical protein [Phenylobacterium ferrooxidans]|uniref:Phage tail assembly chaperone n=1 Tax=Phenylobacterium ferrooxidans TaxID=2982689 RepID=A0ABW6CNC6_9CAUL
MAVKFDFKRLGQPFEADWPVRVNVPQDGGGVQAEDFTARFRLLTKDDFEAITQGEAPGLLKGDPDGYNTWRMCLVGLKDEHLTAELKEGLLSAPYVRQAIIAAYQQFSQGIAVKN